ncbi:MAG: flavodoxin domain-containing protein [Chloroflexi bacterium]|jgi:flavodoxin|nr:flavodoxin domain-containing protein [Chloroflexota bacterium]
MATAAVVYESITGVTERFGEAIGEHLRSRGVEATVISIGDCDPATLDAHDLVLIGCWTSGLFVVGQHPDREWVAFTRMIPTLRHPRVGLFTTYRLATGSMFRRMRRALEPTGAAVTLELKSRDGRLAEGHRADLDAWLAAAGIGGEGRTPGR